jgi:hypothetical protein
LNSFDVSGVPTEITAGVPFSNPVIVTALDRWGNIKSDFTADVFLLLMTQK